MGIIFSSLNRLVLGRSLKYSFAFTGEDRIIESLLKAKITYNGFYVDVGANHPKFLSNTYSLYRKGWRGICIDANKNLIKKYEFFRPKDHAVHALVSDIATSRTFYQVQNNVLSTTDARFLRDFEQEGLEVKEEVMQSTTLTDILDRYHAPKDFDLLGVDAEEHDLEVLKGMDWNRYRPRLVVVEDETFDFRNRAIHPMVFFMQQKGYDLKGYVLKNLYFMPSDS
ncbi:FkbM family methyltransferase [Shivajiella indica]|uniref:FkbM family methyltransferase n=1 Tax=Shivajiella indica TaxID=872115 RepID=A0ABW5BAP9_9BACT